MVKQKCKNCIFYTAYYRQLACSYARLENGYCSKHNSLKTQLDICDDLNSNELKEKRKEALCNAYLPAALKAIIDISSILKEKESNKLLSDEISSK